MVEILPLPGPTMTNVAVAPTAYLPSIKHITTGSRDVSLQELRACVDYLRLLYNPEVRGSRRRRTKGRARKSTHDSRPRSRSKDGERQREGVNAVGITAVPSITIDSIRADAFERAHSIRWLTSLVAHADEIFLRVVHHSIDATNNMETRDSASDEDHGTSGYSGESCEMKDFKEVVEAKAMQEKLIGEAAALLAACAGTAGSGRVSRTYAFDLPSVDDDDAPSGLSDGPSTVEQDKEKGRGRRRGTTGVTLTLTDAPLENGDYASVGAQTWGAACVMADMIFEDPARFFGTFPFSSNILPTPSGTADSELGLESSFNSRRRRAYRVLELGAGTGLVGMSIAKLLGFCNVEGEVVLTDVHPSVLTNLRSNVSANFPEGASNESKVEVSVSVHSLEWSSYALASSEREGDSVDLGTFDLIVGADIIYEKEHALWIRACLERLLRPPPPPRVDQDRDQDEDQEAYFHLVIPLRRTHVLESSTVEQVFGNNNNIDENIEENKFEIVHQERFSCDPYSSAVMDPADEVEYAHFKIGWKKAR